MSEAKLIIKSRVSRLLEMCTNINNTTNYCAFFSYIGHVEKINIRISKSKLEFLENMHESDIRIAPFPHTFNISEKCPYKTFLKKFNNICDVEESRLFEFLKNVKYIYVVKIIMEDFKISHKSFVNNKDALDYEKMVKSKYNNFSPIVTTTKEAL